MLDRLTPPKIGEWEGLFSIRLLCFSLLPRLFYVLFSFVCLSVLLQSGRHEARGVERGRRVEQERGGGRILVRGDNAFALRQYDVVVVY